MASIDLKRKFGDISATNDSDEATELQTKKQKLDLTANNDQKSPKNYQNNNNAAENIPEQIELPPEILVSIFCQLSRADLSRAGAVCQHWWLASKDESLSWFPVITFYFIENRHSYELYGTPQTERSKLYPDAGPPVKVKAIEYRNARFFAILTDKQGNLAAIAFEGGLGEIDEKLIEALNHTECLRLNLDRIYQFQQGSLECWRHFITLEANLYKVEQNIRLSEGVAIAAPFRLAGLQKLSAKLRVQTPIDQYFKPKESYLPTVLPVITEQPQSLTGVKLHNYQINAINWMVTTEQQADDDFEVSPLLDTGLPNILVKYTPNEEKLVLLENASEHNLQFKPKGGVLADEMGLGKTIEMLGLILSNPMKQVPKSDPYFATKATLVLCPNHLVDQWVKEVEEHSEPKLSVITITTIAQVKKITYQQIIDADVVVVTYNLLKNKNYLAYPNNSSQFKMDAPHDRIARVNKMLVELKDKAPEKIKGVILEHFHWHRIVMDEGHEVIGDEFTMDVIYYLQRTFSWYMSGTPFPTLEAVFGVRTFLDMFVKRTMPWNFHNQNFLRNNWISLPYDRPLTEAYVESLLNQLLMDNLVWRNTKESVSEEYQMVVTKPEVVLLDFTPIEAAIYEELQKIRYCILKGCKDPVRELCCKLNYDWGSTLHEMREFMIKKKLNDISFQNQCIDNHKAAKITHENTAELPSTLFNTWQLQTATRFLADYQMNLDALEKTLEGHKQVLKSFQDIKPQDTSKIKYNTKDYWIENYGTKMASLVGYLQTLFDKEPGTRVIIFSQFTDYLDMIAALLEENNINSSVLEGNVYKKSKALKKFKADESDVQVILLSLSKAASGTNLIEASHVLLMDPMTGTKEEAQAYENQAIGRAQRQGQTKPVTVVRFVIKNTIEHEFYVRNTGTKQHGQVMLNRSNSKLVRSSSFGTLIANNNNN